MVSWRKLQHVPTVQQNVQVVQVHRPRRAYSSLFGCFLAVVAATSAAADVMLLLLWTCERKAGYTTVYFRCASIGQYVQRYGKIRIKIWKLAKIQQQYEDIYFYAVE